jgi:hypothetical protein
MKAKLLVLITFFALLGCGGAEEAAAPVSEETRSVDAQSATDEAPAARRLVKRAELHIRVPDTRAAVTRLEALTAQSGGYVEAVSADRYDDVLHYSLTLRVPVERLDATLAAIRGMAKEIDHDSVTAEDVTEQYVDLEARLRTLRTTETELLELLGTARESGRKLEDVMAVYGKLTEIRTTIEQIEGQRKALEQLSALSTVRVELLPSEGGRPLVAEGWRPGETLRRSARTLVTALQGLANLAVWLIVVALPLGAIIALPVWAVARALQAVRRRRAAPPGPDPAAGTAL